MHWLLFDLHAPLASFGSTAPGTIRNTDNMPSRSVLLGLCAAALGIRRSDADAHARLDKTLMFASRSFSDPRSPLLRDYHTAQAPKESALKRHPCHTRRDEVAAAGRAASTVLSDRYYLQDLHCTIGAVLTADADVDGNLEALSHALRLPRFVLYVGRKSCPLQWPLQPRIVEAEDWLAALEADSSHPPIDHSGFHKHASRDLPFLPGRPQRCTITLAWDARLPTPARLDDAQLGQLRHVRRRDQPLNRVPWRHSERTEVQWTPDGAPA